MSRTAFVAKAELAQQLYPGTFLHLIGPLFLERFDDACGRGDMDAVIEAAWARRRLGGLSGLRLQFGSVQCDHVSTLVTTMSSPQGHVDRTIGRRD